MNKLINNSKLIKDILLIIISSLLCVFSLVFLIQSYSFYSDEWGTDISFEEDYVVALVIGAAILAYSIVNLVAKSSSTKKNCYYLSFGVASALIAFYPLGIFFKSLAKEVPYLECQAYLYVGIIGLFFLGYVLMSYLSEKKK